MGLLDEWRGSRAAEPGVIPISAADLRQKLLDLNRDDLIWRLDPDAKHSSDLTARWKFDDPRWSQRLTEAGMRPALRVCLRLHEEVHVVRSVDDFVDVRSDAGPLSFLLGASFGRGQLNSYSADWTFGRRPDGKFGLISSEKLSTDDIKNPLRKLVTENGWAWRGVLIGRL